MYELTTIIECAFIVMYTYMGLKAVDSVANGRVCVVEELQVVSDATPNGRLQLRKHDPSNILYITP